ncbi:MAG TPA: DUF3429 domain-containing protein [Solimonas sp.]|nr:DUF3429 domain-containing protein [Solimonas sp.]
MNLPKAVLLLGYLSLVPFILAPAWLTLSPQTAPPALDQLWLAWMGMVAAFMAGTFWGFALPAVQGPEGLLGIGISVLLVVAAWGALVLPFPGSLAGFALVFLLLLLADFWRERTLDTIGGYFRLRSTLTVGVLVAIAWRYAMLAA